MATLRSLYTTEVTAFIPLDILPPGPPSMVGLTQEVFQQDVVTHGRSVVTLRWAAPLESEEIGGEYLGTSNGLAQSFEATYDNATSYDVYEMSNFGGVGRGDTTLTADALPKDKSIEVADASNFAIGDWIQIDDGSAREYVKIAGVSGTTLELETRLLLNESLYASGATVKEADALLKTEGVDYTFTPATGALDTIAGQFTGGNDVALGYITSLLDLNGFTILRNPNLLADTSYESVVADGDSVLVTDALLAGATSAQDTLTAAENGEDWYYYVYAKDDELSPNRSEVASGGPILVETIPSIPQNLAASPGDASVILSWDSLGPGGSDGNTDGFNVYRNDGNLLDKPNLQKLNAVIVPVGTTSFKDNQAGIDDSSRVGAGTVPLPTNGQFYTYVVEAEDSVTGWTTGTQNQSFGQAAQATASKTA